MTYEFPAYVFGADQTELARLLAQAEDLKLESDWLLDQIGIKQGWRVADIGCGPIGVLDLLSERVGSSGNVVGVERESRFADMARVEVERRGLKNVSIVHGDALGAAGGGYFDLVHERLVLINMPLSNRQALVAGMIKLARPGGVLALESWDRASLLCFPEHPSWQILNQAYRDAVRATTDGDCGRTLPWLLHSAGAIDVQTKVHVRAVQVSEQRRSHRLSMFDVTKQKVLALGRLNEAEFDAHRRAVADHLADPTTLLIDALFVQAWGTAPR